MEQKASVLTHTFEPVFGSDSEMLILGSFPSELSRKNGFYYGNPRNRFWQVLSSLLECEIPESIEEKRDMLIGSRIALWDVVYECEIEGSSDASLKLYKANDIASLLEHTHVTRIFANGQTAGKLYKKYVYPSVMKDITVLPSTSPANASFSLSRLTEAWRQILPVR